MFDVIYGMRGCQNCRVSQYSLHTLRKFIKYRSTMIVYMKRFFLNIKGLYSRRNIGSESSGKLQNNEEYTYEKKIEGENRYIERKPEKN